MFSRRSESARRAPLSSTSRIAAFSRPHCFRVRWSFDASSETSAAAFDFGGADAENVPQQQTRQNKQVKKRRKSVQTSLDRFVQPKK